MYISTREMVISIICNACGVIGLILWAIEAHKSNASQRIQSVESVDRKDEPQADYVLSKDSDAYKFNKRMEVEEEWLNEQREHDILYEPTYDLDDGSM